MKRIIALFFLLSIASIKCLGYSIYIQYNITKDSNYRKHNVNEYYLDITQNTWNPFNLRASEKAPCIKNVLVDKPGYEVVLYKYKLNRSGNYIVNGGFYGHVIYLDESMDGDTIYLQVNQLSLLPGPSKNFYLNDSVPSPWAYQFTYPDKYKYLGFYDSLAYSHGDLSVENFSFKQYNHDLKKYLATVNTVYKERRSFLEWFALKYHMPAKMKYFASKEIQYCYYFDLYNPIMEYDSEIINEYPEALKDSLTSFSKDLNNKSLFDNTSFYKRVILAHVSTFNISNGGLKTIPDSNYCVNRLKYCKANLKNEVQGYALAWFMNRVAQGNSMQPQLFNIFYKAYNHKTSEIGVNEFVDSLKSNITNPKVSSKELLEFAFEDSSHHQQALKNFIAKDIVLIDCWATWCIPCRQQIPYLDSLSNQYKNKIQFISLSADQFVGKWDKWMLDSANTNSNILQLHADKGFEHPFFKRLMINAIPRYILIKRSGEIVNVNAPRPSEPALKKAIDNLLNDK